MGGLRIYVPLIAFVVPTAIVAYGFVIPGSPIQGLNALTVGFAASLLGAVAAYVLGIRIAHQPACPASKPLSVRINRWINRQAANPRGPFAMLLAFIWRRDHRRINARTIELLEIAPHHHVVEIGFGPGEALALACRRAKCVTGVDVSQAMLQIAARRNRAAIREGRMKLRVIEDGELELEPSSIDRAVSVHTIYFWSQPQEALAQIAEALTHGGRLVLGMRPDSEALPQRFRDPSYRFYSTAAIEEMLVKAGFLRTRTIHDTRIAKDFVWIVADR